MYVHFCAPVLSEENELFGQETQCFFGARYRHLTQKVLESYFEVVIGDKHCWLFALLVKTLFGHVSFVISGS